MIRKIKSCFVISVILGSLLISGCGRFDAETAIGLGVSAIGAMSVTNKDIIAMTNDACREADKKNKVLPESSPETLRVKKIASMLDQTLVGQPVNFKVYESKKFNAFAMPNGCIRVNSAKLNEFTDEEIASVIAHEMGHVALQHSLRQYKNMSMIYIGLIAGTLSTHSSVLNSPAFQNIVLGLTQGQYSQKHELEADEFAVKMLIRRNINPNNMVSMLEKIKKMYGGGAKGPVGYFASHPNTDTRIMMAKKNIAKYSNTQPGTSTRVYPNNSNIRVNNSNAKITNDVPNKQENGSVRKNNTRLNSQDDSKFVKNSTSE